MIDEQAEDLGPSASTRRLQVVSDIWLAVAVCLTTATQLRAFGPELFSRRHTLVYRPVGPGECLLVVWIIASLVQRVASRRAVISRNLLDLFLVVIGCSFLGILGLCRSFFYGLFDMSSGMHNLCAYLLCFAFALALLTLPRLKQRLWRIALLVLAIPPIANAGLWVLAKSAVWENSGILWHRWRYRGWATNPNQTALTMVVVPFVCLHLFRQEKTFSRKAGLLAVVGAALLVGRFVDSQAFYAAVLAGTIAVAYNYLGNAAGLRSYRAFIHIAAACMAIVAVFASISLLPELMERDYEVRTRVRLFTHGVDAVVSSPLLGLGPGSYSGLTGPFQHEESHNIFVELACGCGMLGLTLFLLFLSCLGLSMYRCGQVGLLGALTALLAFGQFHQILRHPYFWFCLIALTWLSRRHSSPQCSLPLSST